jgi:formylmethanofuran:tetrahydromethanopterin formyltransferase
MIVRALAALALLALAACGEPPAAVKDLKEAAGAAAQDAIKVAASTVDTQTACTLAGQSEAFCGCLQTELGPQIAPEHVETVGRVLKETLGGKGIEAAATEATGIDPKTRQALISCATKGAIGAATEAAQQ